MAPSAFTTGAIETRSGRRIGFASLGDATGLPVLYLHGAIGSPLQPTSSLVDVVDRLGLRWICVQRPGFAGSSPDPERTIRSFAADVAELARALALPRSVVLGVSAGGPYALACGHELPDWVATVSVCSSLSPLCAPHAVPGVPARVRLPLRGLAAAPAPCTRAFDATLRVARRWAPRTPVGTPTGALLAATRDGSGGLVADYLLSCRPWGFALEDVSVPVHVWHGARDRIVPVEHAWQIAASLPTCRTAVALGEGHFFFRRRIAEIVGAAVAQARGARLPAPLGGAPDGRPRGAVSRSRGS
jgi:pimeloyl-ACP methyl ester carboxylesterase